jgi:hypothetical protein
MDAGELKQLAADAYVYGFPLVFDLDEVVRFTRSGMGAMAPAPFNVFSHARRLAGPQDTFVSINNDTVYSIAQLDLGAGPLLLRVPDTAGRYYVLQFVDAWTNNVAYVGRRATGTGPGTFLLTGPGWTGTVPGGARQIRVPTRVASIVGRFACDGAGDLPAVERLQEQLALEPLARGGNGEAAAGRGAGVPQPGSEAAGLSEPLAFFERMRLALAAFPPPPAERAIQVRYAPLGLLDAGRSLAQAPAQVAAALEAGHALGRERLEQASRDGLAPPVNGWGSLVHLFDYNVDWLELGTIDRPEWKLADRERGHLMRAVAARVGLWGNHAYEAFYAQSFVDRDGRQLNGAGRYEIRFERTPPVDAFWSLTMYDTPDYYLVANPIGRYSIGDRTPGLVPAADGSLTLVLQREQPQEPERRERWLPAPEGDFRPLMRLYQPRQEVLDGSYVLPPIVRVG